MILWAAVVAAALVFLYLVRGILLPFVLAFIISVLLDPTIRKLRARGYKRTTAIALVFFAFFGILTVGIVRVAPLISGQLDGFSTSFESFTKQISVQKDDQNIFRRWNPVQQAKPKAGSDQIDEIIASMQGPLQSLGLPTTKRALFEQYVEPHRARIAQTVRNGLNAFLGILGSAASQFLMLLFTPIFVWLILSDLDRLKVKGASWIPPSIRGETVSMAREVGDVFIRYLRGVTITIGLYSIVMAIVLSLLGAPYSILFGLLFGAFYLIPYIGPVLSLGVLFTATGLNGVSGNWFMSFDSPWAFAAVVLAIFFAVHMIYDQLVYPRLVGRAVGLNPLVSMFVIFSGGALFGFVGMILAFPLAGSIKIILERLLRITSSGSPHQLGLPAVPLRHRQAAEV